MLTGCGRGHYSREGRGLGAVDLALLLQACEAAGTGVERDSQRVGALDWPVHAEDGLCRLNRPDRLCAALPTLDRGCVGGRCCHFRVRTRPRCRAFRSCASKVQRVTSWSDFPGSDDNHVGVLLMLASHRSSSAGPCPSPA